MAFLTIDLIIGLIVGILLGFLNTYTYEQYLNLKVDDYSAVYFRTRKKDSKFVYLVSEDKYLELSSNSIKYLNSQLAYKVNHE